MPAVPRHLSRSLTAVLSTMVALLATAAAAQAAPSYEPNDVPIQAAGPLQPFVSYSATIETENDDDWFVFAPRDRQQVSLALINTSGDPEQCSVDAGIRDRDGEVVAGLESVYPGTSNDTAITLNRGVHYVKVTGCIGNTYSFRLTSTGFFTTPACIEGLAIEGTASRAVQRYRRAVRKWERRLRRARRQRTKRAARRGVRRAKRQLRAGKRQLSDARIRSKAVCG